MPGVSARDATPPKRRVPTQERSRRRVEELLDAAARLVVSDGVEAVSTREIARAADVPVASLYQYFADKDALLLALAGRDMAEMDEQVLADLAEVKVLTVASLVRTTMKAFVTVYHRRRAFVEIYLRGRTNSAVNAFGREHNKRIAETLRAFAIETGIAADDLPPKVTLLAVEIGDRVFQLAFEHTPTGEPDLIEEGILLVTSYVERYATPAGRNGVRL